MWDSVDSRSSGNCKLLKESGVKKAGILATSGTVQTGLFQTELQKAGIAWEIPDQEGQQSLCT